MVEKKRAIALKAHIAEIISGRWNQNEGLNYILTRTGRRLSRVRVLSTVVAKFTSQDKKFASITLDDGTETIRAKAFNSFIFDNLKIGDIVDVIGKMKQYNDELYITPEIVMPADANWELLRELEMKKGAREWDCKRAMIKAYQKQTSDLAELKNLAGEFGVIAEDVESIVESQEFGDDVKLDKDDAKQKVLEMIATCDQGEGCDYSELIERSGMDESALDETVQELLGEGSCFEPRPGKIKRL
jgi:RPA family protein